MAPVLNLVTIVSTGSTSSRGIPFSGNLKSSSPRRFLTEFPQERLSFTEDISFPEATFSTEDISSMLISAVYCLNIP